MSEGFADHDDGFLSGGSASLAYVESVQMFNGQPVDEAPSRSVEVVVHESAA